MKQIILPNGWWFMPAVTGSRGPRVGRRSRLAGPRPDDSAEREAWLDRVCEHDEPPEPEEEYEDFAPLTAEELAEIRRGRRR